MFREELERWVLTISTAVSWPFSALTVAGAPLAGVSRTVGELCSCSWDFRLVFFVFLLTWLCYLHQFAGFSAESLCERILDCGCSLLITAGKTCLCALEPGQLPV